MSTLSGQQSVCVDSCDQIGQKKHVRPTLRDNDILSGSCEDLSHSSLKHSMSIISHDDSVSSKGSFSSLFPNLIRPFEASSSFTVSPSFVPRPEKTLALFDIIISTLKDLHRKYSNLTDVCESTEGGEVCGKVDARIVLLQSLRSDYQAMIDDKEAEMTRIQFTVRSAMSSKSAKEELDMMDCERYWALCREMCLVESKLERCGGKLQFQVMELDSVARISAMDQYELAIRLNEVSKFKTRIKVEKNGHQAWDNTTFVLNPTVDDTIDVKFFELKTLNKPTVLLDKKVPLVNNLILAEPSIYSFWLTPVGTIKLRVIVQWNAVLDDPELKLALNQIDNKFHETVMKDGVVIRKKANTGLSSFSNNRLSVSIGSLFRSDGPDRTSFRGSMGDIAERVEDEARQSVNVRKNSTRRNKDNMKAEYHSDVERDNDDRVSTQSSPFVLSDNKVPVIITEPCDITEMCQEQIVTASVVYRSYGVPQDDVISDTVCIGLDEAGLTGDSVQRDAGQQREEAASTCVNVIGSVSEQLEAECHGRVGEDEGLVSIRLVEVRRARPKSDVVPHEQEQAQDGIRVGTDDGMSNLVKDCTLDDARETAEDVHGVHADVSLVVTFSPRPEDVCSPQNIADSTCETPKLTADVDDKDL